MIKVGDTRLYLKIVIDVFHPTLFVRSPSPSRNSSKRSLPFARSKTSSSLEEIDEQMSSVSSPHSMTPPRFDVTGDIDPELVRTSLRDYAQKMKEVERERDELTAKNAGLQRQLATLEKDRNECEQRVQTLQKALQETEEGRQYI